jgi:hypothetical protein
MSDKVKGIIFVICTALSWIVVTIAAIAGWVIPEAVGIIVGVVVTALTGHNFIWPKRPNTIRNTE